MTPLLRSVAARTILLTAAFAAVPVMLSGQFSKAEAAKRATLLRTVQAEAHLIAEGVRIGLLRSDRPPSVIETRSLVEHLDARGINMRLLLRPAADPNGVFLIATSPPLPPERLDAERQSLIASGIVSSVPPSCDHSQSLDLRYRSGAKGEEVISSMTPFMTPAGCWVIITSHSTNDEVGSLLGRPYWRAREVRLAAAIYGVLAVLALTLFGGLWRSLVLFGRQARSIGCGDRAPSFSEANRIPELNGVAQEFDRMVASLRASSEALRRAAEDNAHAFKTPIGTIAQSVEAVRRSLPGDDARGRRSLQLIEQSVMRLDALVTAAREMDEANASAVNPPHERINLSQLSETMLATYGDIAAEHEVRLSRDIAAGCWIWAGGELMETVMENILDNAISFSPPGSCVAVKLRRDDGKITLIVDDEGPGAPPDLLPTMFERYVSRRPASATAAAGGQHYGIGLWVVRRNIESVGGKVRAENREPRGLRIVILLEPAK